MINIGDKRSTITQFVSVSDTVINERFIGGVFGAGTQVARGKVLCRCGEWWQRTYKEECPHFIQLKQLRSATVNCHGKCNARSVENGNGGTQVSADGDIGRHSVPYTDNGAERNIGIAHTSSIVRIKCYAVICPCRRDGNVIGALFTCDGAYTFCCLQGIYKDRVRRNIQCALSISTSIVITVFNGVTHADSGVDISSAVGNGGNNASAMFFLGSQNVRECVHRMSLLFGWL